MYSPGVVNVNENLSSVSITFDLNSHGLRGDGVRDVVVIGPGHGGAGLHRDPLRAEHEIVDLHFDVSAARTGLAAMAAATSPAIAPSANDLAKFMRILSPAAACR